MSIRWDKLTLKAQEAVQRAGDIAAEHGNPQVLPIHLLMALLEDRDGIVPPVLAKIGAAPAQVLDEVTRLIEREPRVSGAGAIQPNLAPDATRTLEGAFQEANNFKDEFVSTEHLLLGLTQIKGDPAQLMLARQGVTHDSVLEALR